MSIADPIFKWTRSAINRASTFFSDVDISDNGAKVVVSGSEESVSRNQVIVWVLNAANGSIIK
jgi:hypothetical protein